MANSLQNILLELKACLEGGVLTQEEFDNMKKMVNRILDEGFEKAKMYKSKESDWLTSKWEGFKSPAQLARIKNTGVNVSILKTVGEALYKVPTGFQLHPRVKKYLEQRKDMIEMGKDIDWATAESLAFGTLLLEGNHVRLSGQDVERGTFSHRHAIIHDQKTDTEHFFLNNIPGQKSFAQITNSFLSEFAVVGFELGFSLESPNALVMWEAQFGDFANGAQIIIDQFLSAGEQNGYVNVVSFYCFLMAMKEWDLNTVVVDLKDFYNYRIVILTLYPLWK